jgi:Glyoxalase-like domain
VQVRWLTAFIDRPATTFEVATRFWLAATGTTLSAARGATGQFATLLPSPGDAFLRVQRVDDGRGGCHLDVHVDDVATATGEAVALGALIDDESATHTFLRSPAGLRWCLVSHRGEVVRPLPTPLRTGDRTIVDQLCIDIPADRFDEESAFWTALSGWQHHTTPRDEFSVLTRPDGMPLRLLLQRLGVDDARIEADAHLDLACDNVEAAIAAHEQLGARVTHRNPIWTAMADPSGLPYCLTSRNPDTGLLWP